MHLQIRLESFLSRVDGRVEVAPADSVRVVELGRDRLVRFDGQGALRIVDGRRLQRSEFGAYRPDNRVLDLADRLRGGMGPRVDAHPALTTAWENALVITPQFSA